MKTTALSIAALLCVSLSYAQEKNLRANILPTAYGSFGNIQTESSNKPGLGSATASNIQFKQSSFKTSDGGTATFVNFNTKPSKAPVKIIPTAESTTKTEGLKVLVYPNPTTSEINIVIQEGQTKLQSDSYIARIKNLMGQNIYEQKFEGKQLRVDASSFAKGFFLVEVSTTDGKLCHTEKVVIQ